MFDKVRGPTATHAVGSRPLFFPANGILGFTDTFLQFAFHLIGLAAALCFLVTGGLADSFFGRTNDVLGVAFRAIFVHRVTPCYIEPTAGLASGSILIKISARFGGGEEKWRASREIPMHKSLVYGGSDEIGDTAVPARPKEMSRFQLHHRAVRTVRWFVSIVFLLLFATAAGAQDTETTVRLDGRAMFRVTDDGETSSQVRADRVEQRLGSLLENLDTIPPASVSEERSERVIAVAGVQVVRVLPLDAENSLTPIDDLAAQWAAIVDRELASARERRLGWGGRFVAETRGAVQSAFAGIAESAVRTVPRVLAALLVLSAFVLLAWGVHRLLRAVFRRTVEDQTLENLIKQSVYYAIVLLGVIIAAGALGISPQGLVTGLGLTGLVLGFALKDILSNFVSGLLILALRPFKIGDQIVVGETEGAVERIELRATQIRAYDGRVALVPNAEVFTSRIVNNTADPIRRGNVRIRAGYDLDLKIALPLLKASTAAAPGVIDRPVSIRVESLGADDLELDVSFWSDSRRSDFKDTCSAVRTQLLDAMPAAGIAPPQPELRRLALADTPIWKDVFSSNQRDS